MDEKGAMMGKFGKQRVIVSKSEKKPKTVQDGSREWTTFIERVSLTGRLLGPWVIFKGKVQQKKWHDTMKVLMKGKPHQICVSDNG